MRELTYKELLIRCQWAQFYSNAAERVTLRDSPGTLAPQICGVQYSIANRFPIDTPITIKNRRNSKKTIITSHF